MATLRERISGVIPSGFGGMPLLRTLFVVHFVFVTLVLFGQWVPLSYLWYNAFFLLALLWAVVCVQADTASLSSLGNIESPLSLSIFLNTFAFVIDLLVMASSWPTYSGYPGSNFPASGGWNGLSLLCAILLLIARPPTSILLYRMRSEVMRIDYVGSGGNPTTWDRRSTVPAQGGTKAGVFIDSSSSYQYDLPPSAHVTRG